MNRKDTERKDEQDSEERIPASQGMVREHMWAPGCFHGSVGNGWDVVSKYIESQDVHHAKNRRSLIVKYIFNDR